MIVNEAVSPDVRLGFTARAALRVFEQLLDSEPDTPEDQELVESLYNLFSNIPDSELHAYNVRVLELVRKKFPR